MRGGNGYVIERGNGYVYFDVGNWNRFGVDVNDSVWRLTGK